MKTNLLKAVMVAALSLLIVGLVVAEENESGPVLETKYCLSFIDLKVGEGAVVDYNVKVECHYTIWPDLGDGKKGAKIQSSKDGGTPFTCTIGQRLITGWSDGMVGMKEGGTRELRVPYQLGYGASGMGDMIPGKQDLIFEIEFIRAM